MNDEELRKQVEENKEKLKAEHKIFLDYLECFDGNKDLLDELFNCVISKKIVKNGIKVGIYTAETLKAERPEYDLVDIYRTLVGLRSNQGREESLLNLQRTLDMINNQ